MLSEEEKKVRARMIKERIEEGLTLVEIAEEMRFSVGYLGKWVRKLEEMGEVSYKRKNGRNRPKVRRDLPPVVVGDERYQRVFEGTREGKSAEEIGREIGMSRQTVYHLRRDLKMQGFLEGRPRRAPRPITEEDVETVKEHWGATDKELGERLGMRPLQVRAVRKKIRLKGEAPGRGGTGRVAERKLAILGDWESSNRELGARLGVSPQCISNNRREILREKGGRLVWLQWGMKAPRLQKTQHDTAPRKHCATILGFREDGGLLGAFGDFGGVPAPLVRCGGRLLGKIYGEGGGVLEGPVRVIAEGILEGCRRRNQVDLEVEEGGKRVRSGRSDWVEVEALVEALDTGRGIE